MKYFTIYLDTEITCIYIFRLKLVYFPLSTRRIAQKPWYKRFGKASVVSPCHHGSAQCTCGGYSHRRSSSSATASCTCSAMVVAKLMRRARRWLRLVERSSCIQRRCALLTSRMSECPCSSERDLLLYSSEQELLCRSEPSMKWAK